MNDMTTGGAAGAVAALNAMRKGLQNVKQTLVVKGGDPFLRLLKHGEWVYGQEDATVGEDSLWVINPLSLQHGFIAWPPEGEGAGSGPLGEVMVPMTMPLPGREELRDVGAPWSQQFSIQMKCVEGEDTGTQVLYKVGSTGGTNAMDKVITAMMQQLDDDPEHPAPIVQLLVDSYDHKKWGRTFVPVLQLRGWSDMNGAELLMLNEPEAKQAPATTEPAKAKRTRAKSTPAVKAVSTAQQRVDDDTAHAAWVQMRAEPSLEELEALLAERKAAAKEDPAAARKRELMAELAALDGGASQTAAEDAPAAGQPIRRRRP